MKYQEIVKWINKNENSKSNKKNRDDYLHTSCPLKCMPLGPNVQMKETSYTQPTSFNYDKYVYMPVYGTWHSPKFFFETLVFFQFERD